VIGDEKENLEKLVFASCVFPEKASERRALLMVESIRAFAGSLSKVPIWCFKLDNGVSLSATAKDRLTALNTELVNFDSCVGIPKFPFMWKAFLSAEAESMAQGKAGLLVWLDADTIVLQEPKELLLKTEKSLGCRPVHHTNIGSRYDKPIDPFWTQVYRYCKVPKDRVFPIRGHVDETRIRPYFNAGLLVARPEKQLLRAWRDSFVRIHNAAEFQRLYEEDQRYTTFMHQAVLTGTILSNLKTSEIEELPPTYNYPLHLYSEDATGNRPSLLEELVTFRYEDFFESSDWRKRIPTKEPLKQWITKRLLP
jgi:hypothetical protein